jgi:hypothetical protein
LVCLLPDHTRIGFSKDALYEPCVTQNPPIPQFPGAVLSLRNRRNALAIVGFVSVNMSAAAAYVFARTAAQYVVAPTAAERIVALAATENIVSGAPINVIVAAKAVDYVVPRCSNDIVVAASADAGNHHAAAGNGVIPG